MSDLQDFDPAQEAAVDRFMGDLVKRDPAHRATEGDEQPCSCETCARVADVAVRYPVLTPSELAWRRSRETRLTDKFENTISLCADLFGRRIASPKY